MPALSPARGWATLQAQLLREVRAYDLEALRYVRHVRVTGFDGPAHTEKREEPLSALMAETAASGHEAGAEEAEAQAMALRKARAKVALRSALDNQLHCVAPGIFIAAVGGAKNLAAIQAAGITHIINASPLVPCFHKDVPGLEYTSVNVYDTKDADIAVHFEPVSALISAVTGAGGGVLVHCYAGQSRSAALVAAHLMLTAGMRLGGALETVQAARPCACPNLGFIMQLKRLEGRLFQAAPKKHKGSPRHSGKAAPATLAAPMAAESQAAAAQDLRP